MMKANLKMLSIMVSIILLITMLAGCGKSQNQETGSSTGTSTGSEAVTTTEPAPTGPSWTLDTSPFSIDNWYIGLDTFVDKYQPETNVVCKEIRARTGLESINFTTPASTANQEKLNAMIASNNLPDVITLPVNRPQLKMLIDGGYLLDIQELADKNAPDLSKSMPQSVVGYHKSDDGKLYYFPNGTNPPELLPQPKEDYTKYNQLYSNLGVVARTDIMEQLGIKQEDFSTQDGFIAALKKVQDAKIEYNGKVVNAFSPGDMTTDIGLYFKDTAEFFGLSEEDAQGNYALSFTRPEYLELVKFYNRLFREGFLKEEQLIKKIAEVTEEFLNNPGFCLMGNKGIIEKKAKALQTETKRQVRYIYVDPPKSALGAQQNVAVPLLSGWLANCITKTAKNPERIVRLFSFLNSDEGQMLTIYGIEGVTYEIQKNPKTGEAIDSFMPGYKQVNYTKAYQDEVNANARAAAEKYGVKAFLFMRDIRYRLVLTPMQKLEDVVYDFEKDPAQDFVDTYNHNSKINLYSKDPFMKIDPSPDSDMGTINSKIKLYMNEELIKMVVAKTAEEVDSIYNNAMNHIKELGSEKLIAYKNEQLQKVKKNMGLEFANPSNKK